MASVRSALAISFVGSYGIALVQLVGTMILARLLTPHEIGVYSIATVFMGFINAFRDMGVGQYLIQERDLTAEKIRRVYGALFITAWFFAPLVYFAASPLAAFYAEPGLMEVLHVLAISLLLIPFGATVQAGLSRNMQFGAVITIRLMATLTQAGTGIFLAWKGLGFMSLAWAAVARVAVTVVISNCYRPRDFFLLPVFTGLGEIFRFGGKSVSMTLIGELSNGLPEIVLGKTLGMAQLGLYSRAQGQLRMFNALFMRTLTEVGTPYFARLHRRDQPLQPAYERAAEHIVGIAWPMFGAVAIVALPLIRVLYGPQWVASASLVSVMCVSACIGFTLPLSGQILMATGRINAALTQTSLHAGLFATALIVASPFGLTAVAWAGIPLAVLILAWRYLTLRRFAFRRGWLRGMVGRNVLVAVAAMTGPAAVRWWFGVDPEVPLVALAIAAVLAGLGWMVGLVVVAHPLVGELVMLVRRVAPRAPLKWVERRVRAHG